MRTLFITRKYPPSVGGMESLSYHLTTNFAEPKRILAMRTVHQIHLIWFVPYAALFLLIRGWRYDVIHLSDLVLACLGWIGKYVLGKPVFITIHGLDFTYEDEPTFLGKIFHFYMSLVRRIPPYVRLLSNSRNTKSLAEQHHLGPVEAIPLGIQLPEEQPGEKRKTLKDFVGTRPDGAVYLLSVGRLVKRKGVMWFLQNVFLELPDNIQFVIVGPLNWRGGDQEPKRIQSFIQQHNLGDRVHLLGRVSNASLHELYRECDIFLMPNIRVPKDVEGFGIVAGEAALSGMPVLASNIEGIPDAIQDQKNGRLLPPGDAGSWISAVQEWIDHPEARKQMGEKAAVFTREQYSWQVIAERYFNIMKNAA